MDKNALIKRIVDMEWDMFSTVQNTGGKAACQSDPSTFRIMRESQCNSWDEELLTSYLADLEAAREAGRNLMTEKYARMMESTFPDEYAKLAHRLPAVNADVLAQIEEIVAAHLQWKEALDARCPHLSDRGRPLRSKDDYPGVPSLETYMRGELRTYSPQTIALYHAATLKRMAEGRNEAEENLLHQVRQYGFADLDQAEDYFSKQG